MTPGHNFLASGDVAAALAERTAQVDRLVIDAASQHLFPSGNSTGIGVLAVGGYGRRHLFPHSDVDLLLLYESNRAAEAHKEAISIFLRQLWDSGMRVSQSVRAPAECLEVHDQNTELNISLLDQRYLAGDRGLYGELARRLPRFIHGSRDALIRNLSLLTRDRHAKYAGTFYHLEPNVKETPGGLRDYQLLCWLEQLRETDPARMGAADPSPELRNAFRHLSRIRCFLHMQAGRDHNQLSFDAQDTISEQSHEPDAAVWMRDYYRHARAVYRAATRALESNEAESSSLFAMFRDRRSRVSNADFSVLRDRVHFRTPQRLDVEPGAVLDFFEFVARHGARPSYEAEQQIQARLPKIREHFHAPQPVWPALRQILTLPFAALAVRAMHETGAILALFPELEQIECLVIRDFYHRYTVDEHTLVAMQVLWDLRGNEESGGRQYADLMAELKDPAVLLFALWFHDAGKGAPGEGHVDASLRLVEGPMARIQMPQADREMVLFLIDKHLELSAAMQSRDISDPHAIEEVAHRLATVERLKNLTLLTYADISAVNPQVMTPWRSAQLWQLYLAVYNELTRELEAERIEALPASPPERAAFLEGFPTRYLRTHTDAEIDEHIALEERNRKRDGSGAADVRKVEGAWVLTMVAGDRPGLFASAAGLLSSFGMNILKAEAFANRRGLVLDTFTFADPNRNLDLNPSEVERLRATAERVISGKTEVRELLRNRPKPALPSRKARIQARVSFDLQSGAAATLIEIVAEDRPGLLYDLASAISSNGCNIEVVLIDTQAHKAIDVFYVTEDGRKLSPEKQRVLGEELERACVGG
jgi:[protein-PII] uridylyltransferase